MLKLTEFLRARLNEDEAIARKACEYAEASWKLDKDGTTVLWWPPEPRVAEMERQKGLPVVSDRWRGQAIESSSHQIAPHIARHDPARVLAEVDANRKLVTAYESAVAAYGAAEVGTTVNDLMTGSVNSLRYSLQLLALPYAEHPDFKEEWRP